MQVWGITDPGCVRPQNQDTYVIEQLDKNSLLCVVCDGMGGARSGNVASSLAAEVFTQEVRSSFRPNVSRDQHDAMLLQAAKVANFTVYDQAVQFEDFAGMGTTMVAALVIGKQVTVLNVGDSRAYRVNEDGIRRITTDHSLVQMMLQRGELTPEQAKSYPGKNLITRAIGTESSVQCDLFHLDMERDDNLILCSDGLTNVLDEQEILFEVIYGMDKESCCQRLLEIAKNRGASDNVTCVLAQL